MMDEVARATDGARRDKFEDLVRKLAVHETAEAEVVHPLLKKSGDEAALRQRAQGRGQREEASCEDGRWRRDDP